MIRECPYCGSDMVFIEEPHLELWPVAYERGYWECFKCGCVMNNEDFDMEDYGDETASY